MADPVTPNFGFTLPTVGADRDVWGALLNANWQKADDAIQGAHDAAGGPAGDLATLLYNIRTFIEPIGSVKAWPLDTASCPPAWIPCDGTALSRVDFANLFNVIGTTWGIGDGATTFNLPDFRSCVLVHREPGGMSVGEKFGEWQHDLTLAEMPNHIHTGATTSDGSHNHAVQFAQAGGAGGTGTAQGGGLTVYTDWGGTHYHTYSTNGAGGSQPHNNMQPSVGVMWIIKATYSF